MASTSGEAVPWPLCAQRPPYYSRSNSSRRALNFGSPRRAGLQSVRDNLRTFEGRSFSRLGHLPPLRRLASGYAVYPALPGWAKVFRASGAAFRITNHLLQTTSFQSGVTNSHSQIPSRPRQFADPQPAAPMSRSRIGRARARAPEARQKLAQPGRAGNGGHRKFEHRRCDTLHRLRRG